MIKLRTVKWEIILDYTEALNSITSVFIREKQMRDLVHTEEQEAMWRQRQRLGWGVQPQQRNATATRSWGRRGTSPRAFPATPWLQPSETAGGQLCSRTVREHTLLVKPPGWWLFVCSHRMVMQAVWGRVRILPAIVTLDSYFHQYPREETLILDDYSGNES